jgi:hypothetical protein
MRSVLNKNLSLFLLLAYIYIAVFGLAPMTDHHHDPMVNCPYMIGQSLCSMNAFEHIGAWKKYLLSISVSEYTFIFFILSLVFVIIKISASPTLIQRFLYYKKISVEPIISFIQLQFSQGLLNPKPY